MDHDWQNWDRWNGTPKEITRLSDLPEFTEAFLEELRGCGEASYGLGNRWSIDWDRFYEVLEMSTGLDMQDLGGPADNKIRRLVQKMVREGDIS